MESSSSFPLTSRWSSSSITFYPKSGRRPLGPVAARCSLGGRHRRRLSFAGLRFTRFPGGVGGALSESHSRTRSCAVHAREEGTPLTSPQRNTLPRRIHRASGQWPGCGAARVDALLKRSARRRRPGDHDENHSFARPVNLSTRYTSVRVFLRALLRPRVIRPGPPVLRVKDRRSRHLVVALFRLGLVQKAAIPLR